MTTSTSPTNRRSHDKKPPKRKDTAAALRAAQALTYRMSGKSYEVIATLCGYADRSGAYRAIQRELQRTIQEPAEETRTLEVRRLDALYEAMEAKALKGDTWSVDRCLKIMERRAMLLGLDAPKVDPASVQPIRREYVGVLLEAV